jgi:geranylgeranyl pyrophosphate synthase
MPDKVVPNKEILITYQTRVERALNQWLPKADALPQTLHEAMRYATLDGGKRVRPVLVYATGSALGVPLSKLDGPACAVELIHAYSLVHDDLPAMDDDELRRGKATCHIAFDEATAILTGDALQSLAFYLLAHDLEMAVSDSTRIKMIEILANACGSHGMAGGQAIDLASVGHQLNLIELENMHIHKTGALIRASVKLGALSCENLDNTDLDNLDHYAKCIGLAFQIRDDILDVEADTATLGKKQGADRARDKPTYTSIIGIHKAKTMADELYHEAVDSLAPLGKAGQSLAWIAEYIINRQN